MLMPTQPKLPNISAGEGHSPRFRNGTAVMSAVLMRKYSSAEPVMASNSTAAFGNPSDWRKLVAACKAAPAPSMAMLAVAGLMIRLVQRLEVRHEPTSPSPAAASVAAAGHCSGHRRKTRPSPARQEFFE